MLFRSEGKGLSVVTYIEDTAFKAEPHKCAATDLTFMGYLLAYWPLLRCVICSRVFAPTPAEYEKLIEEKERQNWRYPEPRRGQE